jgi:hypothetical protein
MFCGEAFIHVVEMMAMAYSLLSSGWNKMMRNAAYGNSHKNFLVRK